LRKFIFEVAFSLTIRKSTGIVGYIHLRALKELLFYRVFYLRVAKIRALLITAKVFEK